MAHERFYVQCNMFLQLGIRASFAAWFSVGERSKIYIQLEGGNLAKGIRRNKFASLSAHLRWRKKFVFSLLRE